MSSREYHKNPPRTAPPKLDHIEMSSYAHHGGDGQAGCPSVEVVSTLYHSGCYPVNTDRLDGDTLGMDGAQVGVLEQRDEVRLNRLLESTDGRGLESQVGLEVLGNLTNLEMKLLALSCLGRHA